MATELTAEHVKFTPELAIQEASRCLQCGDVCSVCVSVCPNRANQYYQTQAEQIPVWKIRIDGLKAHVELNSYLTIEQKYQTYNVADFCNECGNCTTFCPTKGAPYLDKPRICLTEQSFNCTENGFYFKKESGGVVLMHHTDDALHSLHKAETHYTYSTGGVSVKFNLHDFAIQEIEQNLETELVLQKAAEMKVLIDNVLLPL